jgi:Phage derived protein Gp49-like (DUF891)
MVEIELRAEVADWLSGLSAADQKRAKHAIDRLASLGHMARMPFSRSLGDGLFELPSHWARRHGASPTGSPRTTGSFS